MWRGGKKLLLVLVFLLLCSVLVSAQPVSSSDQQLLIYESELNSLLSNMRQLQSLNEKLKQQLIDLENNSKIQIKQLKDLQTDLDLLIQKLKDSVEELKVLKEQLMQSQKELGELQLQLQKANDSYKSLYESFLVYQKETEKQINKLKVENMGLVFLSSFGWVATAVFVVLWIIERFVIVR